MTDTKMITPYGGSQNEKKSEVATMFNNISGKYDFLNHFLSVGIDKLWRKKVVRIVSKTRPQHILDVATGTGDLAVALIKTGAERITGIDISEGMLEKGKEKIQKLHVDNIIHLEYGDSENIQYSENSFDAITVAFGVRNYQNLQKGLQEMYRVLKPESSLVVLEFSKPSNWLFKQIYFFYFCNVLPFIGRLVSKDARAYTYLPESVRAFPDREDFVKQLKLAGFKTVQCTSLTFGISTIYEAVK